MIPLRVPGTSFVLLESSWSMYDAFGGATAVLLRTPSVFALCGAVLWLVNHIPDCLLAAVVRYDSESPSLLLCKIGTNSMKWWLNRVVFY